MRSLAPLARLLGCSSLMALLSFAACGPPTDPADVDAGVSVCAEEAALACAELGATCEAGRGCVGAADGYCDELEVFCEDGFRCVDFLCE